MQKYFSIFLGGMPGLGLLMLRLTLGTTAIVQGIAYLLDYGNTPFSILAVAFFAVLCGAIFADRTDDSNRHVRRLFRQSRSGCVNHPVVEL